MNWRIDVPRHYQQRLAGEDFDGAFETAAAIPLAGLTALRLVNAAGSLIGRRVLITGASGGVGHYVVELASQAGASVTAVSRTARDSLSGLGADEVVADVSEATGPFDVVMESVGGTSTTTALRALARRGLFIWFGSVSKEPAPLYFFDFFSGPESATIRHFHYADVTIRMHKIYAL